MSKQRMTPTTDPAIVAACDNGDIRGASVVMRYRPGSFLAWVPVKALEKWRKRARP